MRITLGVVMDPIDAIKPYKDSTLAMLLQAQQRGWSIAYMEMDDLWLRDGQCQARMRQLQVSDSDSDWYRFGDEQTGPLAQLDVLLMRKDPPFDTEYVYATQLLELAERQGLMVVNRPQSLRDCNEKLFSAWFPQLTPATLVSRRHQQIQAFINEHEDVVIKPLGGMGGASIFRIRAGDPNTGVIIETLTAHGSRYAMLQQFIAAISEGDKRILMIDGEAVPYVLARIPAKGENRGNLAAGGSGRPQPLSATDRQIAEMVGPALRQRGILFAGLDVIGDRLTEINVTSPTCIRELDRAYGINIAGDLLDVIERRLCRQDC
jgi:glutathione synthase